MRKIKDYLIILKIKSGDVGAWEKLVEKYYDKIFNYCKRRFFGKSGLAEDLTQETFLKVISSIDSYKFSGSFFNYLFTIAVNTCNSYSKKNDFDEVVFDESYNKELDEQDYNVDFVNEQSRIIQRALDQLPEYQREAIILKFFYDMKIKEIAQVTKTSVPTAQSRIQQGLVKMKRILKKEEYYFE
ncbi:MULTISPECIES: sigma-70 family RNA polymerase sigma factor [unclassified Enterococcus]|uniref:sigma-70 family RNA polymerase sigma factor n=1 Tax=unclassified Enterococcus TaxID=2608891 RepID=UPI001A92AF00|nr:RNA polymerase sigma factor [Enterococcus sp. DIV1298c]MBO1299353.1 RNA polymerase sigma factor [Enterococcus sp. DIV1271a]